MSTYQTNRCYAEVTAKAWADAMGSGYKTYGLSAIAEAIPEGWKVVSVSSNEISQRVLMILEGTDAEWNISETAGLDCIGVFTTSGNTEPVSGVGQTADVCRCLEQLFGQRIEQNGANMSA